MKRKKNDNATGLSKWLVPAVIVVVAAAGLYALLHKGKAVEQESKAGEEVIAPVGCLTPEQAEIVATVYLDNSVSMKGYAIAQQNTYIDVLASLTNIYPDTKTSTVSGEDIPTNELIDRLVKQSITYKSESLLDQDLAQLANDAAAHALPHGPKPGKDGKKGHAKPKVHLNFFVTDGIMCGPATEVKPGSDYNKLHATDLQNSVEKAFAGKPGIGVSVYQFSSAFTGTYYCYDNEPKELNGQQRNFYVIAIGDKAALADFKHRVAEHKAKKDARFIAEHEWHAIDRLPLNTGLSVAPVQASGSTDTYQYDLSHIRKAAAGKLAFTLPLTDLLVNHYVEDLKALTDSTVLVLDDHQYAMKNDADKNRFHFNFDAKSKVLHFDVSVDDLTKESVLTVRIPTVEPQWIAAASTDDDKQVSGMLGIGAKTFLFDMFIHGIENGVCGKNANYLYEKKITLKQQ